MGYGDFCENGVGRSKGAIINETKCTQVLNIDT